MRKQGVLFTSIAILTGAMTTSASAQLCSGLLSWLCPSADSSNPDTASSDQTQATSPTNSFQQPEKPPCLSLGEVHGGYPMYHVVGGRRCWFASSRRPPVKSSRVKAPTETNLKSSRAKKSVETNVNPYGDPIWNSQEAEAQATSTQMQTCEEQALKLDSEEKRTFLKECTLQNGARNHRNLR